MRKDLYQEMYRQEQYYWWHRAKRELVKLFLPKKSTLKILDIGCGTGKLVEELEYKGDVWGVDRSKLAVAFCRNRGLKNIYQDRLPELKKVEQKFDVVTCLDVLEHVIDDDKTCDTISRLLKKNGRVIITVPAYPWLFSYWDKMLGHKRRYTPKSLTKVVENSKLKITKISYLYSFLLPIVIPFRFVREHLFSSSEPKSDFIEIPPMLHSILLTTAILEQKILKYINIRFGLSIICIATKT